MPKPILYHNPRCQKSRQAVEWLDEQAIDYEIVEYLKQPPSVAELKKIIKALGTQSLSLLRKKEALYQELGKPGFDDPDTFANLLHEHPKLMERPLWVGKQVAIGRPLENIQEAVQHG